MKSADETHRIQFNVIFKELWWGLKTYEPPKDIIPVYWYGLKDYPIATIRMAAGNLKTGPEFPTLNQWQSVCSMAVTPQPKVEEPLPPKDEKGEERRKIVFQYLTGKMTGDECYTLMVEICKRQGIPEYAETTFGWLRGRPRMFNTMPRLTIKERLRLSAGEQKQLTGGESKKVGEA